MALYEGIALIQEKQAVVLDLGYEYTKFGFTGEAAPRCIIPSSFWCPQTRSERRVHDYKDEGELYDNLVQMLHLLYFRHVLVNPKERRVVVVESLLTPTLFRETLAKVLYVHYEVSSVLWVDSGRAAALCVGAAQALVVSIGAREVEVTAVLHGVPVISSMQSVPCGSLALHKELARMLDEDNNTQLNLDKDVIEDIKVKCCFVASRERAAQWLTAAPPSPAPAVRYRGQGGAVLVSGGTRERAAEIMFQSDDELSSIQDAVLQCIMQSPIDSRVALASNIIVCGGDASLPGLVARLSQQLAHDAALPRYSSRLHVREFKFHSTPCCVSCAAWLGAALCGAALGGGAPGRGCREQYLRRGALPDWPCLIDNTPPHLQRQGDQ